MKYKKLVMNARKPIGFWGSLMIHSMNQGHYALTGWGISKISFNPEDTVLDIGCGGGKTIHRIRKLIPDGKVYGIDYSELAVKKSISKNKRDVNSGKVQITQGSVSSLPYQNNLFDVVTGVETFYFWPNYVEDLKEVLRVLKPGGKLLLVFEVMQDYSDPLKWKEYEDLIDLHVPSEQKMFDYLTRAGFQEIKTHTHPDGWLCVVGRK